MSPASIRPYAPADARDCAAIIESLPDWFGLPESNAAYLRNLESLPSWVALRDSAIVGAMTLECHFPGSFEIHFMAVHPSCHRQGIGRALVAKAEQESRAAGGRWLQVKTLSPLHADPFYAETRKFYLALGFAPLFESTTLWGAGNPALVMIKGLE